jgi:pimeloyl-ACP methyl ester carboxylesterase
MQITVGDLTFAAAAAGPTDGPPVLLLHGFPEGARCWGAVMASLAEAGLWAIAPDQRGYSPGARPEGVDAYRLELLVDDAVGMLDALGVRRAHLVGHDWGAVVAWVLAARHPHRVHSLTAVAVPHPNAFGQALRTDSDQQQRSAYLRLLREPAPRPEAVLLADDAARLRAIYSGSTLTPDQVAAFVAPLLAPGALTAALNWYRAMTAESFADVGPVTVPTTYVWGALDVAVGRVAATAAAAHVSGDYRFVELAQASHWIPEQLPDLLAALALERIRSAEPGGSP